MPASEKGEEIRFIAGKYAGKTGWINTADQADDEVTPVIVDLKRKGEKPTFVYTSSIKKKSEDLQPTGYAEKVILQCPDIEKDLVTVTRKMAKCDVEKDQDGFEIIMGRYLGEAVDHQKSKGSKAMWRKIDEGTNDDNNTNRMQSNRTR